MTTTVTMGTQSVPRFDEATAGIGTGGSEAVLGELVVALGAQRDQDRAGEAEARRAHRAAAEERIDELRDKARWALAAGVLEGTAKVAEGASALVQAGASGAGGERPSAGGPGGAEPAARCDAGQGAEGGSGAAAWIATGGRVASVGASGLERRASEAEIRAEQSKVEAERYQAEVEDARERAQRAQQSADHLVQALEGVQRELHQTAMAALRA